MLVNYFAGKIVTRYHFIRVKGPYKCQHVNSNLHWMYNICLNGLLPKFYNLQLILPFHFTYSDNSKSISIKISTKIKFSVSTFKSNLGFGKKLWTCSYLQYSKSNFGNNLFKLKGRKSIFHFKKRLYILTKEK